VEHYGGSYLCYQSSDGACSGRAGAGKEFIDSTGKRGAVSKDPECAAMSVNEGNLGAR